MALRPKWEIAHSENKQSLIWRNIYYGALEQLAGMMGKKVGDLNTKKLSTFKFPIGIFVIIVTSIASIAYFFLIFCLHKIINIMQRIMDTITIETKCTI